MAYSKERTVSSLTDEEERDSFQGLNKHSLLLCQLYRIAQASKQVINLIFMYMFIYLRMYICIYVYVNLCVHKYIYICIYMCVYTYINIYMKKNYVSTRVWKCMYMYVYTFTHVHTFSWFLFAMEIFMCNKDLQTIILKLIHPPYLRTYSLGMKHSKTSSLRPRTWCT
jgi:hypothetical protein